MADALNQRGASLKLLFASLFVTSFGISGQIAYSMSPGLQASPVVVQSSIAQTKLLQMPSGSVLAEQTTLALAPESTVSATPTDDFLSEVTDTPRASASFSPSPRSTARSLFPTTSPKISPNSVRTSQKPSSMTHPTPTAAQAVPGTAARTVTAVAQAGSLNADKIFDLVNKHRVGIGKVAFLKEDSTCKIAQDRAPQVNDELYGGKKMHSGFYSLNLPYWATENIAAYATEEQTVNWWLSDYIHKKAIESDNKYSCVACSGRYCSQVFTSFVKK